MGNFSAYIKLNLFGPWLGESRKIAELPKDIRNSAIRGQRKAAERLVRVVRNHLIYQDLKEWPELAPSTIRKKQGDSRILIDTEQYLNNIKAWRDNHIYYVGVKRGVTNENGIEVARVAAIHEFKSEVTRGAPRRPLWEPSINDMGGKEGIRDIVRETIALGLMGKGWKITKFKF